MKGNIDENNLIENRRLIGRRIREIRESKNLTQGQLAEIAGMSRSTISKIEAGNWNFGVDMLTLFSIHLDFSISLKTPAGSA